MAYVDRNSGRNHLPSVVGVAAIHALIGYAFISGLAYTVIPKKWPSFIVESIPDTKAPPPLPAPPTPKVEAKQERATTPPREIEVPAGQGPVVLTDEIIPKVFVPLDTGTHEVLPPPVQSKAIGPQVKGARSSWITADDYPSSAIRAEQEGSVAISVRVGTDGRVTACTVTAPSGIAALDDVTCRLYVRRARFSPALDAGGSPIEAVYADRVRWQLPRQ
jgi:protein TonB